MEDREQDLPPGSEVACGCGEVECYWYFDVNGDDGRPAVVRLFDRLRVTGG
jgi:hypothetical protein